MSPEQRFTPMDEEFAIIGMASTFLGREFVNDRIGYEKALEALREQQAKVAPPADAARISQVVAQQEPVVEITEQMAALALEQGDYETALSAANHLYAYGEVDFQDGLGGRAFDLSLRTHRNFATNIRERFSGRDPYLRFAEERMFADIEALRQRQDYHGELQLTRGVIHMVAYNGTLGEPARQKFDPFAVLQRVI